MNAELTLKTCRDFTEVLASKAPVPGGGGAAALVGACGAALCAMVGNLTLGRKKYAAVQDDIQRMLSLCDTQRARLLELVEEQPDEDGQEDGLALALEQETGAPVVPVSGPEEDGEEDAPPPERDGGPEANSGPRAVPTGGGTGGPEGPEEMTKTDGGGAGEAPPPAWEARRLEAPVIPGGGSEAEADKGTLDRESGRDGPEQAQMERRPGVLEWHRAAQRPADQPES